MSPLGVVTLGLLPIAEELCCPGRRGEIDIPSCGVTMKLRIKENGINTGLNCLYWGHCYVKKRDEKNIILFGGTI